MSRSLFFLYASNRKNFLEIDNRFFSIKITSFSEDFIIPLASITVLSKYVLDKPHHLS